jgi:hypothetical protein
MKSDNQKAQTRPSNKLIGWLVSYQSNDRGSYYELRAGRSFIGSGVIQNERLINLDPKESNTAHAVLNASPEYHVVVQDIFSDSGTFVTKSSSGEEIAVSSPVELEHGDWLRVGEMLKFQVCLIHGGSK